MRDRAKDRDINSDRDIDRQNERNRERECLNVSCKCIPLLET